MDWLTFIAKLVSSLAWPAVVVVITLSFRETLAELLKELAKRLSELNSPVVNMSFVPAEKPPPIPPSEDLPPLEDAPTPV